MSLRSVEKAVQSVTESTTHLHKNPVLHPFRIRNTTFKNRVMSTSHAPNYVENALPKQQYQLYHEEKAKGGIGLTMFGGSSNVSIDSPSVFGQIDMSNDNVTDYLREFSDKIHLYDCKIMCQLTHMGRRTMYNVGNWTCPVAPSPIREHAHRAFPKELDKYEIYRIIEDYANATYRCYKGGLDGIELNACGHLIEQFISKHTNKRNDEWGGIMENRARFCIEVLNACRERIDGETMYGDGKDFLIGIRFNVSQVDWDVINRDNYHEDKSDGYFDVMEGIEIAQHILNSTRVDFINANVGDTGKLSGLSRWMPNMSDKLAPHFTNIETFRNGMGPNIPIFHATRIMDLSTARHCIESKVLDMVGMTRAHIADPYIVSKLINGEEDNIRPCVGAAYCIDRIYVGNEALCIHNASTGRESKGLPQIITKKSSHEPTFKIIIIGGGVAGLECGRILAIRGHDVELHEASKDYGGQIKLASNATWRRDLIGIIDWRVEQCKKLGVKMFTESYIDIDYLESEGYITMNDTEQDTNGNNENNEGDTNKVNVIIDATGGMPNLDIISEENGQKYCISTWDILSGNEGIGDDIIIFDVQGNHHGPSCAEFIKNKKNNANVEIITPDRCIGEELGNTNYPAHLKNLYNLGVKMTCDWHVAKVEKMDNGKLNVLIRNEYDSSFRENRIVDQVIVEYGTLPACSEMFNELREYSINNGEIDLEAMVNNKSCVKHIKKNNNGQFYLMRIGDSLVSRNIHAAVLDALRLCKDL